MNQMKTIRGCLLASVLAASLLVSCGKKDWQPEVDRAVKAYEAKRYDEAVPVFVEAANNGHDGGQYMLGVCYEWGLGVEQNYEEALNWYRKAAEQGLAEAQGGIGFCYYAGHGVKQDYTEAAKWIRTGAEQGCNPV